MELLEILGLAAIITVVFAIIQFAIPILTFGLAKSFDPDITKERWLEENSRAMLLNGSTALDPFTYGYPLLPTDRFIRALKPPESEKEETKT